MNLTKLFKMTHFLAPPSSLRIQFCPIQIKQIEVLYYLNAVSYTPPPPPPPPAGVRCCYAEDVIGVKRVGEMRKRLRSFSSSDKVFHEFGLYDKN